LISFVLNLFDPTVSIILLFAELHPVTGLHSDHKKNEDIADERQNRWLTLKKREQTMFP
jgi:hypothetical protein